MIIFFLIIIFLAVALDLKDKLNKVTEKLAKAEHENTFLTAKVIALDLKIHKARMSIRSKIDLEKAKDKAYKDIIHMNGKYFVFMGYKKALEDYNKGELPLTISDQQVKAVELDMFAESEIDEILKNENDDP